MANKTLQEINPDTIVAVVGYPKSGNTLMTGLLGDVLDSPVVGYKTAAPLAIEGLNRSGYYRVTQLHLKPTNVASNCAIDNGWDFYAPMYKGERIVHIVRDARDVAVSVKYYFDQESIEKVLELMHIGKFPLAKVGSWKKYIENWLKIESLLSRYVRVRYEDLMADRRGTVEKVLESLELKPERGVDIDQIIANRGIEKRREYMKEHGDDYMYGKGGQLKLLRKGIVGDWKNHFTITDLAKAIDYFGDTMLLLGYTL